MSANNEAQNLFNVNGMVAVITGGGSGLGLYAARALDANGAKAVYIIGRRADFLEKAAATAKNGTIKPLVGDVTDNKSLQELVAKIKEEQGFVNLLFANAGVAGPAQGQAIKKTVGSQDPPTVEQFTETFIDSDSQAFTKTFDVNVTAVFYTIVAFLPLLKAGNEKRNVPQDSQVLVTSSIAGFSRGVAAGFSYSTSKAAVTHLVKMLSTYFAQAKWRIRANAIAPGFYPSEMTGSYTSEWKEMSGVPGHDGAFAGAFTMPVSASPAERTGSEEDFAGTILYIASRAGAYLNGEILVTDGGRISQIPAAY